MDEESKYQEAVSVLIDKHSRYKKDLVNVFDEIKVVKFVKGCFGLVIYSIDDHVFKIIFWTKLFKWTIVKGRKKSSVWSISGRLKTWFGISLFKLVIVFHWRAEGQSKIYFWNEITKTFLAQRIFEIFSSNCHNKLSEKPFSDILIRRYFRSIL